MDETPHSDRLTRPVSAPSQALGALDRARKRRLNVRRRGSPRSVLLMWLALGFASACAERPDTCRSARTGAANAWSAYVAALERARAEALVSQRETTDRLDGDLKRRFDATAQERADHQAARGSEAWSRAYRDAQEQACQRDDECRGWKDERDTAQAALSDLEARLPRAQAALYAVQHDPARALAAATAVSQHVEYPHVELAQELTRQFGRACTSAGGSQTRTEY